MLGFIIGTIAGVMLHRGWRKLVTKLPGMSPGAMLLGNGGEPLLDREDKQILMMAGAVAIIIIVAVLLLTGGIGAILTISDLIDPPCKH